MRGKTIALLENRLKKELAALIIKEGGRPFLAPAMREVPDIDSRQIKALLDRWTLRPPKATIFQTGVGCDALFGATETLGQIPLLLGLLRKTAVVVRGPKPSAALSRRGVVIDYRAKEPYTTREVLEALTALNLQGELVAVQRHGEHNGELQAALEKRGAQVLEIPLYRWALPKDTQPLLDLLNALEARKIDAVAFTSASQVHNLFAYAEAHGSRATLKESLNHPLIASIGPVCTKAVQKYGIPVDIEPHPPKLVPFVRALGAALASAG